MTGYHLETLVQDLGMPLGNFGATKSASFKVLNLCGMAFCSALQNFTRPITLSSHLSANPGSSNEKPVSRAIELAVSVKSLTLFAPIC